MEAVMTWDGMAGKRDRKSGMILSETKLMGGS
jgi:hypothetical protein